MATPYPPSPAAPNPGPSPDADTSRTKRIARVSLAVWAVVVLLLIFAVPRSAPPPASLANPNEAFVDRAGIVSPAFARSWAGALLNDDRAEIAIYVDRKPPEGDVGAWAIQTASDWKIGASRNDTGLVLFVFTEPRIARIDVGYGLEDRLTDARIRQLLETHLAPAFAAGRYEQGFDALIFAIRKELGGDDAASIHARAAEARRRADVPWITQMATALARVPRVSMAVGRAFLEGHAVERLTIVVAGSVALGVAAVGLVMAVATVWSLVTIPARVRARGGGGVAIAAAAFQIAMGAVVVFLCLSLVALVMLAAESYFTREGRFSGAGAMIVWPEAPR
ncbi:MAG: TPM domain-containing protein [Burkholderiales bacterium]